MGMKDAVSTCFSKYVTFTGRATRSEYWWFILFYVIGAVVLGFVAGMIGQVGIILLGLYYLGMILPILAVAIRRCHDADYKGWWILVPIMNIVLLFMGSTPGPNRFGA